MLIKKKQLSVYSQRLDLSIFDFTEIIRDEIRARLDTRAATERNDKTSIVKVLSQFQGVVSHLITEYRRIKHAWCSYKLEFEKLESSAISFSREELPIKSTEIRIKQYAYENQGGDLYAYIDRVNDLEQKMKTVGDHLDSVKMNQSAVQSILNTMKVEWEAES